MPGIDNKIDFRPINIALLTISDSRKLINDKSGNLLYDGIKKLGHICYARDLVKDDVKLITQKLKIWIKDKNVDVIITTGGTGLTGRDITPEAFRIISDKDIPGFGELFRYLSYESIGTSTIQSRALACISGTTYVFGLPGSPGAVKDGWEKILKYQLDIRNKPCNFIELIPRLKE